MEDKRTSKPTKTSLIIDATREVYGEENLAEKMRTIEIARKAGLIKENKDEKGEKTDETTDQNP